MVSRQSLSILNGQSNITSYSNIINAHRRYLFSQQLNTSHILSRKICHNIFFLLEITCSDKLLIPQRFRRIALRHPPGL